MREEKTSRTAEASAAVGQALHCARLQVGARGWTLARACDFNRRRTSQLWHLVAMRRRRPTSAEVAALLFAACAVSTGPLLPSPPQTCANEQGHPTPATCFISPLRWPLCNSAMAVCGRRSRLALRLRADDARNATESATTPQDAGGDVPSLENPPTVPSKARGAKRKWDVKRRQPSIGQPAAGSDPGRALGGESLIARIDFLGVLGSPAPTETDCSPGSSAAQSASERKEQGAGKDGAIGFRAADGDVGDRESLLRKMDFLNVLSSAEAGKARCAIRVCVCLHTCTRVHVFHPCKHTCM